MIERISSLGVFNTHRVQAFEVNETKILYQSGHLIIHPALQLGERTDQPSNILHKQGYYHFKEASCLLSHLRAIKQAHDEGNDVALIIEDDALLSNFFFDRLEGYYSRAPLGWKILQFATNNPYVIKHSSVISDPFISWMPYHFSTRAYLINKAGMKAILDKIHLYVNGRDSWRFIELPLIVADEIIYYSSGDAYTSTGLWLDSTAAKSTIHMSSVDANEEVLYSSLLVAEKNDELSAFQQSLLVSMHVTIRSEIDIPMEVQFILNDYHAVCRFHRRCDWDISLFLVESSLKETFIEMALHLPPQIRFHFYVSASALTEFHPSQMYASKMHNYDMVLLKDSDLRLSGFPWHTFFRKKGNSLVSSAWKQSIRNELSYTLANSFFHRCRSWHKIEFHTEIFTQIEPYESYLDMSFMLLDGNFANFFFQANTTNSEKNDRKFQQICSAAKQFGGSGCFVIPIVIRQEDSPSVAQLWQ